MDAFPVDGINQVGGVAYEQYPLPVPSARGRIDVQRPADDAANQMRVMQTRLCCRIMLQPIGESLAQVSSLSTARVHHHAHADVCPPPTKRKYPGIAREEGSVEEDVNLRAIPGYS